MTPPTKRVTIKDVARQAGVSTATVSYVLNDSVPLSEETRQRVLATVRELDYHPSAVARRLQGKRTDTLGFVLPSRERPVSDPFLLELLAGIADEATQQDCDLLLSTCPQGCTELDVYKRLVKSRRVDGLLLVDTRQHDERLTYLLREDFPFVAFGRSQGSQNFPYVDVDGEEGVAIGMRHLLELGHRRIAFIGLPSPLVFAGHRLSGYRRALARADFALDSSLVVEGDLTQQGGYLAAQRLLSLSPCPTAIFAGSDLMALGALRAAQERGLVVGRDVSIIGFDDIPLASQAHPPLTTIRQPVYDIGRQVCHMLIALLRGESLADRRVILKPTLVVRESTGMAQPLRTPEGRWC